MRWALDPSAFQAVVAYFGLLPVMGLVATPLNLKLLVFLSPFCDQVAFSVSGLWDSYGVNYAFPPMLLVHDVVMWLTPLQGGQVVHHYHLRVLALTT